LTEILLAPKEEIRVLRLSYVIYVQFLGPKRIDVKKFGEKHEYHKTKKFVYLWPTHFVCV